MKRLYLLIYYNWVVTRWQWRSSRSSWCSNNQPTPRSSVPLEKMAVGCSDSRNSLQCPQEPTNATYSALEKFSANHSQAFIRNLTFRFPMSVVTQPHIFIRPQPAFEKNIINVHYKLSSDNNGHIMGQNYTGGKNLDYAFRANSHWNLASDFGHETQRWTEPPNYAFTLRKLLTTEGSFCDTAPSVTLRTAPMVCRWNRRAPRAGKPVGGGREGGNSGSRDT